MALRTACLLLLAALALASCPSPSTSRLLRAAEATTSSSTGGSGSSSTAQALSPANLWQLLESRPDLSIFKQLATAAGIVDQLNSSATIGTLFVPNNAAFGSYFAEVGRNQSELARSRTLSSQLLYHLHTGSVLEQQDMSPGTSITMANGGRTTADVNWDSTVQLRDAAGRAAEILQEDIPAGNTANAHVISRVLVPVRPANLGEALSANSNFSMFLRAMQVGGYNATLNSSTVNMTFLVPSNSAWPSALQTLNLTFPQLLDNHTLLSSIVSAHILPGVYSWQVLSNYSGDRYFPTCNSCTNTYTEVQYVSEDEEIGPVYVTGVGSAAGQSALIVYDDLIAGRFALIQVLDTVFLPLGKWATRCPAGRYGCQVPADGESP